MIVWWFCACVRHVGCDLNVLAAGHTPVCWERRNPPTSASTLLLAGFFSLIGMLGCWLAAAALSPLKHLRLALSPAVLAHTRTARRCWGGRCRPRSVLESGSKAVRWPNGPRKQKQQVWDTMNERPELPQGRACAAAASFHRVGIELRKNTHFFCLLMIFRNMTRFFISMTGVQLVVSSLAWKASLKYIKKTVKCKTSG